MSGIDFSKFQSDVLRVMKSKSQKALASINNKEKEVIGFAAIDEIKRLVSKGISPIAGNGRFEAYKGVSSAAALVKSVTSKVGRRSAKQSKKSKYPYSVQNKFPEKRERPVNLFLSGDFLNSLEVKGTATGLLILIKDKLSIDKERGHREGSNGQPRRPIIPIGSEEFSPSIYRRIVDTVTLVLRQKFKT